MLRFGCPTLLILAEEMHREGRNHTVGGHAKSGGSRPIPRSGAFPVELSRGAPEPGNPPPTRNSGVTRLLRGVASVI
jgi:hypothetical protein